MQSRPPSHLNNALWRSRKSRGLGQKQVAWLLGHRSSSQISSYERGDRSPSVETALKLAVIYGRDVRELFPEHYESFSLELAAKSANLPGFISTPLSKEKLSEALSICSYEQLLADPFVSEENGRLIRKHITKLAKALANL